MQALERPSEAEIAERFRRYFKWRFSGPLQHFQQVGFVQPVQHFQDGGQVQGQGISGQAATVWQQSPTHQNYPSDFPAGPVQQPQAPPAPGTGYTGV